MNSEFAHVLNYVAHEDFITQTGKKSKPAPVNFMGPRPEAEKNKYPYKLMFNLNI